MSTRPARRTRPRDDDDSGFTLLEVTVSMTILTIFLAIFGGSMISMFNSVNKTTQTGYAQSQVNQLYSTLDTQIRYANGISQPALVNGDYVIEFVSNYTGTAVCSQLRLSSAGQFQLRTWNQDDSAPTFSAPRTLASDVTADTPQTPAGANVTISGPFAFSQAADTINVQRLEIALQARQYSRTAQVASRDRHLDVTFSALNTGTSTSSTSVCSVGRSVAWPAT